MVRKLFLISFLLLLLAACTKVEKLVYPEKDRVIKIGNNITIDNGVSMVNPNFNYEKYDAFLEKISNKDKFLVVKQKDFLATQSTDKVIVSLRYDIDENIDAAIKFAYRQQKYGITSTFFALHTASYYGTTRMRAFTRNSNLIYYLKALQDTFGNEVGFHNDLVTLQIIYQIEPKTFLRNELEWLRENGIDVTGTAYHGNSFTSIYHYNNSHFWFDYPDPDTSHDVVTVGYRTFTITRDWLANYGFDYEAGQLEQDYFFTDSYSVHGSRWNLSMVDLDTIKPGKKVIILLHPQHWDGVLNP